MTITPTHQALQRWSLYRERGWWEDRTLYSLFAEAVAANSDAPAIVDGTTHWTYTDLSDRVDAIAAGLSRSLGVGPGDVVAYQLPNWWETEALLLACSKLGAIVNPLHLVYRAADLRYVLGRTSPRAVFVPGEFGGTDYVAMLHEVLVDGGATAPVVVRPRSVMSGTVVWDDLCIEGETPVHADAAAVSLVLFTSGTTARPKGALHSDNTLVRLVRDMCERYDLTGADRIFVPSTMTHVSGLSFVWSAHLTGGLAVLLDRWDQRHALDVALATDSTFVGGATPFIRGLVDEVRTRGLDPSQVPLRRGNCGSADVPISLIAEADAALGAPFSRGYGLTEGIIVSASRPDDTLERRGGTDGEVLPVNEVRIVDLDGQDLAEGSVGEIAVRGPSNFLGYLDGSDNDGAFLDESWIRTGDLGVLNDGYLTIAGRIKDIVCRGGENIAVKEIEDRLSEHDDVVEVALVGMPDAVMGERCCAYVVAARGRVPTLEHLRAFLTDRGVARQKLPERLELRSALPLTSTGKIQKNLLRDEIREVLAGERGD